MTCSWGIFSGITQTILFVVSLANITQKAAKKIGYVNRYSTTFILHYI